jgi:bloom syndrome protein
VNARKQGPITKKTVKKQAAESATTRPIYPSTNVSSPVRPTKQSIRQYALQPAQKLNQSRNGYEADGFVAVDEEDNEESFEPVRAAKPRRAVGQPITADERMAGLGDFQKDVLNDFMEGGKKMAQAIQSKKNLRKQPFSDTVLREMGLDLPRTVQELLQIPGIDPVMVEHYGKRFLPLIDNTRAVYGQDLPTSRLQTSRRRRVPDDDDGDDDDDDDDEVPLDPNHRNVIDLTYEDDREPLSKEVDQESSYSFDEADDNDEEETFQTSHHFTHPPVDPRVEEYNRQRSQFEAERQTSSTSKGRSTARAANSEAPKRNLPWAGRRSSGNHKKSYSGVKKTAAKKTSGGRGSSNFGAKKRAPRGGSRGGDGGGGGGSEWARVMAMPT